MSSNATSIAPNIRRPKKAVAASDTTANTPIATRNFLRRSNAALLMLPPTIDPTLNAARNVEINHAHTMIDEPKCGFNKRDASS